MIEYIRSQQRSDYRKRTTNMKRSTGVPPPQKQKATKEPTTVGTLVDSVYGGSDPPGISRNNCIMLCKQCKHQTISQPNHTQPNPTTFRNILPTPILPHKTTATPNDNESPPTPPTLYPTSLRFPPSPPIHLHEPPTIIT